MYALTPSLMTGVEQIDAEHQDLVMAINRIGAAEQEGSLPDTLQRLGEFRDLIKEHFESEERYLLLVKYPGASAHAKHHAETVELLTRLEDDLQSERLVLGDAASQCFYELLGAVLTMDMRVLNWLADQK